MIDIAAARTFVHSHARLLDRRRFQHLVDHAPADLVVCALSAYRNTDGGIGALEPDQRTSDSQPIPVRYAFDVLAELPASDQTRSLALGALDWLTAVSNDDGGLPLVLASEPEQPAAPWLPTSTESSLLATAQLAAGAHRLGLDHPWLTIASAYCWARTEQVTPGDGYTFLYFVDLLDSTPERDRAETELDRLGALMPASGHLAVEGGAEGEGLDPLTIAPRPQHAGVRLFEGHVLEQALDTLEAGQGQDGGWDFDFPHWNPAAVWEWRGAVTVDAVRKLMAYHRA